MKIAGKKFEVTNQKTVRLKRTAANEAEQEIVLIVSPLPMGYNVKYRPTGLATEPRVPIRYEKTEGGRVLTDEDGDPIGVPDYQDERYQKKSSAYSRRLMAIQMVEILRNDPNVEWETAAPSIKRQDGDTEDKYQNDWMEYATSIATEIEDAGFTDSEVAYLIKSASQLELDTEDKHIISNFS